MVSISSVGRGRWNRRLAGASHSNRKPGSSPPCYMATAPPAPPPSLRHVGISGEGEKKKVGEGVRVYRIRRAELTNCI